MRIFSGGIGLNNKIVSHRLPFDKEKGVHAFEDTMDILIDRTGEVVTKRDATNVNAGSFHSMFKVPNGFFVVEDRVSDSAIYKAIPDSTGQITLSGIRSGLLRGAKVSFLERDGEFLYSNGTQSGIINDIVSEPWPTNEWTGSENNSDMVATPAGIHLGMLSGRILLAVGKEIIFTEYGLPGIIDNVKNRRRYKSKVSMILPVQTGVYVSDEYAVYFLTGNNPRSWTSEKVLDYPAVEWGTNQDLINPSMFGLESYKPAGLFATVNGPVIGMPDGTPINLTEKNVTMPKNCGTQSGSILVVDETTVIQSGE